jgi:hypothetical protein
VALVARFNIPVTNEQYTTSGVFTLLQQILSQVKLDKTARERLVGYSIYFFGLRLVVSNNHDIIFVPVEQPLQGAKLVGQRA